MCLKIGQLPILLFTTINTSSSPSITTRDKHFRHSNRSPRAPAEETMSGFISKYYKEYILKIWAKSVQWLRIKNPKHLSSIRSAVYEYFFGNVRSEMFYLECILKIWAQSVKRFWSYSANKKWWLIYYFLPTQVLFWYQFWSSQRDAN